MQVEARILTKTRIIVPYCDTMHDTHVVCIEHKHLIPIPGKLVHPYYLRIQALNKIAFDRRDPRFTIQQQFPSLQPLAQQHTAHVGVSPRIRLVSCENPDFVRNLIGLWVYLDSAKGRYTAYAAIHTLPGRNSPGLQNTGFSEVLNRRHCFHSAHTAFAAL